VTVDLVRAARPLDRRSFLRFAGVAAAAGVLPSGCGGVPATLAPPADLSLAVLRPRDYATLTAAALRIVGPRGAALIDTRTVDVGRIADSLLGARTPAVAAGLAGARRARVRRLADRRQGESLHEPVRTGAGCGPRRSRALQAVGEARALRWRALARPVGVLRRDADVAAEQLPGPFGLGAVTIADALAR
jgi:hypothetical protein